MVFTAPCSIRSAMTKIHRKMPGQSGAISGISGANPGNEGLDNSLKHKDKESGPSGKLTDVTQLKTRMAPAPGRLVGYARVV
jgi:hypothetical protein